MVVQDERKERLCSFYVSEFHLEMILLPYINEKIKKGDEGITLSLVKNPDILKELGSMKGNKVLVGFCMETENLEGYARKKLAEKNLDFIVANSLREEGAGFGTDTNVVTIIDKNNQLQKYPVMSKSEVGHLIFDRISEL